MRAQDLAAHRGHTYEDQALSGEFDALDFCGACGSDLTDVDAGCPPQLCRHCTEPEDRP